MIFTCKTCGEEIEIDGAEAAIALAYAGNPEGDSEFTCEKCECKKTGALA